MSDASKEKNCVILCEGDGDKAFFRHLIQQRQLPPFEIICPNRPEPGGRQGYQARLESFRVESRQFEKIRGIIVVSDNDENPSQSFKEVITHIKKAEGYGLPREPLKIVKPQQTNHPLLAVMMIPWTKKPGNLETLCLTSMCADYPEMKKCLDVFCRCVRFKNWKKSHLAKMKFRIMITALCKSDPNTSLQFVWSRTEKLVSLEHKCFDKIANFLKKFDRSV